MKRMYFCYWISLNIQIELQQFDVSFGWSFAKYLDEPNKLNRKLINGLAGKNVMGHRCMQKCTLYIDYESGIFLICSQFDPTCLLVSTVKSVKAFRFNFVLVHSAYNMHTSFNTKERYEYELWKCIEFTIYHLVFIHLGCFMPHLHIYRYNFNTS